MENSVKKLITAYITVDTMERARNASYWTPGLSLNELIERGINMYVDELEKNNGKPYATREKNLRRK